MRGLLTIHYIVGGIGIKIEMMQGSCHGLEGWCGKVGDWRAGMGLASQTGLKHISSQHYHPTKPISRSSSTYFS